MIEFEVNGNTVSTDSPEDTPLLWVIRDELKLKGTKFGCGIAACGACTVQLEGEPLRTCVTPVSAVAGKKITTIEGLGSPEALHAVQEAWVEHQVAQCGYCQSGQIMQAASLLEDTTEPSDEQIDIVMGGNLCRCGTYPRIRAAVHTAAAKLREA